MKETDLRMIDVLTLLPQRPPFVMIDRLIHFDQVITATEFIIREDNLFVENGILNPCALVENIAQTCAARMGYINQYITKESVKLGFIGSIRNLFVKRPVKIGEVLQTSIEVTEEIMRMTLVNAVIRVDGDVIVESEMKIALTDIDAV